MQDEILDVTKNLTSIIESELPNEESHMIQFISQLDKRFPNCQRTIRVIFEKEYQKKFHRDFVW